MFIRVLTSCASCTREGVLFFSYVAQVFPSCLLAIASGMKRSIISLPLVFTCCLCFTSCWVWSISYFLLVGNLLLIPSLWSGTLTGDQLKYLPSPNQFSHNSKFTWVPNAVCYRNRDLQFPSGKNMGSVWVTNIKVHYNEAVAEKSITA